MLPETSPPGAVLLSAILAEVAVRFAPTEKFETVRALRLQRLPLRMAATLDCRARVTWPTASLRQHTLHTEEMPRRLRPTGRAKEGMQRELTRCIVRMIRA